MDIVLRDLGALIVSGLITVQIGHTVAHLNHSIIKEAAPHVEMLIKSLDVKDWMLYAPIAKDWEKFNENDNKGEVARHTARL